MMNRTSFLGVNSRRSSRSSQNLIKFSFFGIRGWGRDLDHSDVEWFALKMNKDHSVIFETAPKYCISESLFEYEGHSISSKGSRFLLERNRLLFLLIANSNGYNDHLN